MRGWGKKKRKRERKIHSVTKKKEINLYHHHLSLYTNRDTGIHSDKECNNVRGSFDLMVCVWMGEREARDRDGLVIDKSYREV